MKKFLVSLVAVLFLVPMVVRADGTDTTEKELVKVYIFEAGGCPACEDELEYLQGLDSYNKKFEIVRKELYTSHTTWENGADYELGVKVANYYKKALGFTKVTYTSTPLVVISDLYGGNVVNTSLESIIDQAYEIGDKDVVTCLMNNGEECQMPTSVIKIMAIVGTVAVAVVVLGVMAGVTIHNDNKKSYNSKESKNEKKIEVKEEQKEEAKEEKKEEKVKTSEKEEVKKSSSNKAAAKKPTTKKTSSNKTAKKTNSSKTTKKTTKKK